MGIDLKKLGQGVAIAEAERDKRRHEGFMADLFRGRANFSLFIPWFKESDDSLAKSDVLIEKLRNYLMENVFPNEIDRTDEVPEEVIRWLCENGFFALKIPREYGGMDLTQTAYIRLMGLAASWCGGVVAPLSASNTIGLTWPLKGYGTPEQKKKFLPIVAKNPTGFAFTEKEAGSDPANMEMYATRVRDKEGQVVGYRLVGRKWWTTNGPKNEKEFLSPLLCVIAKTVDKPEDLKDANYKPVFSAFIVPTNLPGVKAVQRCQFEGLRGMYNGVEAFDVELSKDYLVGEKEGLGFRIALEALNTGRIAVAGSCAAIVKQCLLIGKWTGNHRKQWGKLIGQHEAVGSGMLAKGLAGAFAMEAMTRFAAGRVDQKLDARMEAASCKVFASEAGWKIVDDLMQLRGGRGYETADSLAKRGEPPIPLESIHRSFRPNRIFEGSSEILSQWVIREGIDEYKTRGEVFFEKGRWLKKLKTAFGFGASLAKLRIRRRINPKILESVNQKLRRHLRFVEKNARKLAIAVIVNSARYRGKLPHKQLLFTRLFWIATELYAMSATCFYAAYLKGCAMCNLVNGDDSFVHLADFYCREAELRVQELFRSLKENNDNAARQIAKRLLGGEYDEWLKKDIISITDKLELR